MALNVPTTEIDLDSTLELHLETLAAILTEITGQEILPSMFIYELFQRQEFLGILSENIFPENEENLPHKFGVYRGYNGGGMHGALHKSECYELDSSQLELAEKCLCEIETTFWQILKSADTEDCETWESCAL